MEARLGSGGCPGDWKRRPGEQTAPLSGPLGEAKPGCDVTEQPESWLCHILAV